MDNFQAIGQLVTEARNLLDSIKGGAIRAMQTQFDALKVQFTDKLGAVSGELNAFVNQQKANVNTIFSDPDSRYQVTHTQTQNVVVGGIVNKWYPVLVTVPDSLTSLTIKRWTHKDQGRFGLWNGALNLDMSVSSSGGGGYFASAIVNRHQEGIRTEGRVLPDSDIPFVGRIQGSAGNDQIAIWLRGETSYTFACDYGQIVIQVCDDGLPHYPNNSGIAVQPRDVSAGVDVSVPNKAYVRGE